MKVIESVSDIRMDDLYFKLKEYYKGQDIYLKMEGLNIAGSIKIVPAIHMIDKLQEQGAIQPGKSKIIESSSGNLGVALSIICKERGYEFTCVTDPNTTSVCVNQMKSYGAKIIKVNVKDENGGYLNTRIEAIKKLIENDKNMVWTNQYANSNNIDAHYRKTASEIHRSFPNIETLFVGAGTTGTLGGCVKYFAKNSPNTKIIAVDSIGSVTFGGAPGKRYLPGLGTSRVPEIASARNVYDILHIHELDTIITANELVDNYALLVGASTATVLTGVKRYLDSMEPNVIKENIVAICPDFGEKYIDTLYNASWVAEKYYDAMNNIAREIQYAEQY